MSATPVKRQSQFNTTYELFIGALSVLSIVNVLLIYLAHSQIIDQVILVVDLFLSAIFFGDFVVRLALAPSRGQYFWREFGWADLFSSVPFPPLKLLRIFRIVSVSGLVRGNGGWRLGQNIIARRADSILLFVTFSAILLAEFGGIGVAYTEGNATGANILSGGDAIWYVFVTMTTVGYGDYYPVTAQGRFIGLLIMMMGVAVLAVFTGYIARWFLLPPRARVDETLAPQDPRRQLAEVQAELETYEKAFAELRKKLNEIEKAL